VESDLKSNPWIINNAHQPPQSSDCGKPADFE